MNIQNLTEEEKTVMQRAWFAYHKEMKERYPHTVCRLVDFIAGYKAALGKRV